jgi:hypothetical protein
MTPSIRHFIDLVESAGSHDGDSYFRMDGPEMQDAQNQRSRATLAYMSPDDFLLMAEKGHNDSKAENVASLLQQGEKFSSLPFLSFVHDGKGTARVTGHEGRHRALALKKLGVHQIPVILLSGEDGEGKAIRWGNQDNAFDRVDNPPKTLRGDDGRGSIPMPKSVLYPITEGAGQGDRPDPRSNPQFRAWFGQSKVVDESGSPLVLFHGTSADIHSFKGMVWGSADPGLANEYAAMRDHHGKGGGNVVPLYMRIERPFNADLGLSSTVTVGDFFGAVMEQAVEDNGVGITNALREETDNLLSEIRACARREESGPHYDRHDFWNDAESYFGRDGAAAIRRLFGLFGFDGICMMEGGSVTFGAFSPDQVKSVFAKAFATSHRISEATMREAYDTTVRFRFNAPETDVDGIHQRNRGMIT